MRAIVFLDIDGVLVNRHSLMVRSGGYSKADERCVRALNRITQAAGAGIVVTSSWRIETPLSALRVMLRAWGVQAPVEGETPQLEAEGGTPAVARGRGAEIQAWLDSRPGAVESFVILDDDEVVGPLVSRLVQTAFDEGLTEADADRALELLRNFNAR